MKNLKLLVSTILLSMTFVATPVFSKEATIVKTKVQKKEVKNISNKKAEDVLAIYKKADKNTVFIDVREPSELQEGVIPNATSIPLGSLNTAMTKLDKNKSYVLVCRSGRRSSKAMQLMEEAGFKKLTNLDGGMLDWYKKGYPLKK